MGVPRIVSIALTCFETGVFLMIDAAIAPFGRTMAPNTRRKFLVGNDTATA
ncbi:hypothetical protein [Rhodoglobus aureus]|uniref:hypothetical protein n=1 Tax=Rhodoglobus aureus TaxID=191497 RepID=UPI0031D90996